MNKIRRIAAGVALSLAATGVVAISAAAPASALACGYSNQGGTAYYNHCGKGGVKIRIDYVIGGHEACFGKGVTKIEALGGWNRPTNAYAIGKC